MDDRKEYWWVSYNATVQPAEVGFVGGIPVRFRFIGMEGSIPAETAELIERLPAPPAPIIRPPTRDFAGPQPRRRSGSWLWFFGIILLIIVAQCSGGLYDMIK
ncbi:hypothetical protein [Microvirga zambiensis]|uniref:hypothetical protein n=1 Tax=Microvirga zambiensis TaxID=1402137 RepID=UPI00191CEF05|nr:hypothetical protein [Microvirga zambiensis]